MSYYSVDWHKFIGPTILGSQIFGNRPHTHGAWDVVGLQDQISFGLGISRPRPHTHNYTDLVGSQLLLPDGTKTIPSLGYASNTDCGQYFDGSNINWSVDNTRAFAAGTGGAFIFANNQVLAFGSSLDTILSRVVAGQLLLSSGGTNTRLAVKAGSAQTLNLQEWQNSSGTPLAAIDKDGSFTNAAWILQNQVFGP